MLEVRKEKLEKGDNNKIHGAAWKVRISIYIEIELS